MNSFISFVITHFHSLIIQLLRHIYLSLSSTLLAILIGVPLGILITRHKKIRDSVLGIVNVFQTIPSLALLAFLVPILGIGIKPTIVTLTIYALLPITRNTFTGLHGVNTDILEAANGIGFTKLQRLCKVELPLALPVMFAGIRTATAMTIGITTIAAFIGAGGLGDFITQGLALDDNNLILLGAIPTALLALAVDYILAQTGKALTKRQRQTIRFKNSKLVILALILALGFGFSAKTIYQSITQKNNTVNIASKNFTEQFILANIMADLIRNKTHLRVNLKLNLGATDIIQQALLEGSVDMYPEYTGTAYMTVLHQQKLLSAKATYHFVKRTYEEKFNLIWLKPLGFNNSQTLAVTSNFAQQHRLKTLSDLSTIAPRLTVAGPAEFLKRPDAFPRFAQIYGLKFKEILQMQPDLLFRAINNNTVDVIEVFTTDARILSYKLKALTDDKHAFPSYDAAIVIRAATLKKHPNIQAALTPMHNLLNNHTMQMLNYKVSVLKQSPAKVAHDFLMQRGLLSPVKK